jgi:hypothetical protein
MRREIFGALFLSMLIMATFAGCIKGENAVAKQIKWKFIGNYDYHEVSGNKITFRCGQKEVRLILCTPDMVRISFSPNGHSPKEKSYAVVKHNWSPVNFTISDLGDCLNIQTQRLIIKVNKKPFLLSFFLTRREI